MYLPDAKLYFPWILILPVSRNRRGVGRHRHGAGQSQSSRRDSPCLTSGFSLVHHQENPMTDITLLPQVEAFCVEAMPCLSTAVTCRVSPATTLEVINPATDHVIAHVADANAADVDAAVESARRGFQHWSQVARSARQRAAQTRRPAGTTPRGTGSDRDVPIGQDHPDFPRFRSGPGRALSALLRRLGDQDQRPDHPRRPCPPSPANATPRSPCANRWAWWWASCRGISRP